MSRPLAGCSETLKRFNEALQRVIEALSNLTRPWLSVNVGRWQSKSGQKKR